MKIGINVDAIGGLDQKDYVRKMSELGFGSALSDCKDEEYHKALANELAKYGIEYGMIHAPFDGINAMWGEGGEEMLKRLCHTVDMCKLSGAGIAVIHLSSGVNAPGLNDVGMSRFTRLVEYAGKNGVKIAFENQRKIANLSWALETFSEADNVGFCWDCGHESCFTPGREYMPLFGDRLICTHIHDNTAVYNSDDHMLPFDGNMDFEKVARHLRRVKPECPLTLEVFTKSSKYQGMTAEAFLERAADAAKRLRAMTEGEDRV